MDVVGEPVDFELEGLGDASQARGRVCGEGGGGLRVVWEGGREGLEGLEGGDLGRVVGEEGGVDGGGGGWV